MMTQRFTVSMVTTITTGIPDAHIILDTAGKYNRIG